MNIFHMLCYPGLDVIDLINYLSVWFWCRTLSSLEQQICIVQLVISIVVKSLHEMI